MKVLNLIYKDFSSLKKLVKSECLVDAKSILVQFFDGRNNDTLFREMAKKLTEMLPNAVVIGVSTAGGIFDGRITEESVVISICSFSQTKLIPLYSPECDYGSGSHIGSIIPTQCKATIFYAEGYSGNPESFLHGIHDARNSLDIAGGIASNDSTSSYTLISLNKNVYEKGIVGVAFDNPKLQIIKEWKLDWNPIGKPMIITKAENATVYELDNKPIMDVIKYYFGEDALSRFSLFVAKFALLKVENGVQVARASLVTKENSLTFAGNLNVGDSVRFGIIDIHKLLKNNHTSLPYKPEVLWIYSCGGRKAYVGDLLEHEFSAFKSISPTVGFFSFGEFFKTPHAIKIFNLTTTIFGLSEHKHDFQQTTTELACIDQKYMGMSAVTKFSSAVTRELEQTIQALDAYKTAVDINTIVSRTDLFGRITYVNDLFVKISGYSREELIGKTYYIIHHPDTPHGKFKKIWEIVQSGNIWQGSLTFRSKTAETYYLEVAFVPIFDENGKIIECISTCNDITKMVEQQQRIIKQTTDELTKLPNRIKLFEDINKAKCPNIAIINVDNFSKINHFYGFEIGNLLLKELALEFSNLINPSSSAVYRLSADNFVILADNESVKTFHIFIESLIKKLHSRYFLSKEQKMTVRLSCGLSYGKTQLLSRAEEALREAKARNVFWLAYDEKSEEKHKENFNMLYTLSKAIENETIFPYYQAIVDLKTGAVVKYECLMRLKDEKGNIYTPDHFLEIAKKSKYYELLTRIVAKNALKDFSNRSEDISLNISVEDVANKETVSFLEDAIKGFKNPSRISFELTETEMITDYHEVILFIEKFKSLGVKVCIDDFGSGYSNFAYIAQFKAYCLKIDGSLISKIATDSITYRVVKAINDFAKSMDLYTVAEFVADENINALVKELGVDFAQGYFYAKPLSIDQLPTHIL